MPIIKETNTYLLDGFFLLETVVGIHQEGGVITLPSCNFLVEVGDVSFVVN